VLQVGSAKRFLPERINEMESARPLIQTCPKPSRCNLLASAISGTLMGYRRPLVLTSLGALVEAPLVPASSPHQLTLTDDPLVPRPFQRISPIPTASLQSAHSFGESIVQVYAGGCLHNAIRRNTDGTSAAPLKLSNEESKRRISETWCFYLNRFDSRAKSP